ncbi:galactokinase-like [Watersipora subatra]|uniref:galactokinase-like n=1 Tax=Watersipora subatra TaxID=2589382 RepID=UPI00355BAC89
MADLDEFQLLERAINIFQEQFESEASYAACAPGRVNLIGEHTDYNDGFVFPIAIPQVTMVVGRPNSDQMIRVFTAVTEVDHPFLVRFPVPTATSKLAPGSPTWANYVKGVVSLYPGTLSGFDMVIVSSVPLGGGLSSSASLEVATFTLMQSMFPCQVSDKEKALICQKAEHTFAGMPCGIMDQFISSMGSKDHALLIDCESMESKQVQLRLPRQSLLIINCNVKHQLSGSEYPSRRQSCIDAASLLQVKSLRYADQTMLEAHKNDMSDETYRRSRHVISEIERTREAVIAFENGDLAKFGKLMVASHNSLRDDFEVSCPELDSLVEIAMSVSGVYGSRMTGGGFGGCTITLCETSSLEQLMAEVKQRYDGTATFIHASAAAGAHSIVLPNQD